VTIRLPVRDTATGIIVNHQIKPISLPANVLRLSIWLRGRRYLLLREALGNGHGHALWLSKIKSEHIRGAIRPGLAAKNAPCPLHGAQ
jgi:hypothetical protein